MRTVKEVSMLTGVSIRTLHYYDSINLLRPTQVTESGYRLYDDAALTRLQSILLFRELQFPLKEIKNILDRPNFDMNKALEQQIELLKLRKEHIESLIALAREEQIKQIKKMNGVRTLDFSAFDTSKIDEYAAKAKAEWGDTSAYKEYEEKSKNQSIQEIISLGEGLMGIFAEFGSVRNCAADSEQVQSLAEKLRRFITDNYYNCTPEIFQSLGCMYSAGGSMTENIDNAGGKGTAVFAAEAIQIYCRNVQP